MLYSHNQLYIHIYIQKHIQHNKDERTQIFRKIYSSLNWKGCVWEVCRKLNKDCNILTPPQFVWLSQPFFPVLLGCSTGGPASAGTWFSFQHLLSNWSELHVTGLYNNLAPTYFLRASQFALNSTRRQSRSPSDIFDRMHLLFTQVYFLFSQLG